MRYLAELIWAPHAMRHNPALSWREIDATPVEVSASSAGGPARVWLIFENGDVARIEAEATTASLKAAAFRPEPR